MRTKNALITGITGQDGSYLTELLLKKGYEVHGIVRRSSSHNTGRINHINEKIKLHYGDVSDSDQLENIVHHVKPQEVYNLAAQSQVRVSFDIPEYTGNITGLGVTRVLEAIRRNGGTAKFYQASSSEMFGDTPPAQSESSKFNPLSPYACAKLYGHHMVRNYRDGYGIFAVSGILFNHEGCRRGETFVTRKITLGLANIKAGKQKELTLGNLQARRDWGFAPEYVEAMWLMLQQIEPQDFVIGTGETNTVEDFLKAACAYAEVDIEKQVKYDQNLSRPNEVNVLQASPIKAKRILRWTAKIRFNDLVKIMIDSDFRAVGLNPIGEGDAILAEKFPDKYWEGD